MNKEYHKTWKKKTVVVESVDEIERFAKEGKIGIGDWITIKNYIPFDDGSKGELTVRYSSLNFNTGYPQEELFNTLKPVRYN